MSLPSVWPERYGHCCLGLLFVLVALTAPASFAKPGCAAAGHSANPSPSGARVLAVTDEPKARAAEEHGSGVVVSMGYGALSVQGVDFYPKETWSMIDGAFGFSLLSGNFQLLLEGMISPSRTHHVPSNGYLPAHDVTEYFRAALLRARVHLLWRAYGALGIGIINQVWSSDVGIIRSSDEVTGDWTWGGDIKVLRGGRVEVLVGVQVHHFFAGEGDTRPDFGLTTFHATVLYH